MNAMGKRKALDQARNDAVRSYLRRVLAEDFDGNVSAASRALDMSQPALSDFLNSNRGAGLSLIDSIAQLRGVSLDVVLGRAPDATAPLPNKRVVLASPEFAEASQAVRDAFETLERDDGRDQSVVAWAWALLSLVQAERLGTLRSRGGRRMLPEAVEAANDGSDASKPSQS